MEIEREHCGHPFDEDDPWIHLWPKQPYGDGPASERDMWLCGFCSHTHSASSWRAGFPAKTTSQDVAAMLNIMRETQR